TSEREQITGERGAAFDAVEGCIDASLCAAVAGKLEREQLQIARDDLQQVVEVVRYAAGQIADAFHFLRLLQRALRTFERLFGRATLGNVARYFCKARGIAFGIAQRVDDDVREKSRAVFANTPRFVF